MQYSPSPIANVTAYALLMAWKEWAFIDEKMTGSKTTGRLNLPLIAAIMIILVPASCIAAQTSAGNTLSTKHFTLQWINKAKAGGGIETLILQHPLPISERQMVSQMKALSYESRPLHIKAHPVFTEEDIRKTRRLFTKALNKAHSQNIISFEVDSDAGTIKGYLFASGGNLHWRFLEIEGLEFSVTRNVSTRYGTVWQMAPKKGLKFHQTDKLQWLNWIEAKIDLPVSKNSKTARLKKDIPSFGMAPSALPLSSQPNLLKSIASRKNRGNLEEVLKALKNLYDNHWMNKQEYELKRQILIEYY